MSEPTATIPQIAEIVQLLGTSPTRASTVLSILAHVGYNSESSPAASKAVSTVDESTAVEHVAEYSALPVLPAWFDSLKEHADFFPIGLDRAPTCGSPKYSATTDPEILHNWFGQHRTAGFSARIRNRSRLLVIDLDQKNGCDGFASLGHVLLDHNIELPSGPVVQTPHNGRHLYMLRPSHSPKVVNQVGIWSGVDIMAERGQCILPGSKTRDGEYQLVEGSLEHIPDAPLALLRAIHDRQKDQKVVERRARQRSRAPLPYNDAPACLTPQERFRLFNNKVFRSFWNMGKEQGDTSFSGYEFHLSKACFCVGLDTDQVKTVINWWWKHHNLTGRSEKKLVKAIIPAAWRDVAEYVVSWKAAHQSVYTTTCITTDTESKIPEGRPLSARTRLVLRLADENPSWGIARIASEAVVSRHSAWIALHRHRPGRVYTTTCITTDRENKIPAPTVDYEEELMTPADANVDLDTLYAEYTSADAAGMLYHYPEVEAIEATEAPAIVIPPAEAAIISIMPDVEAIEALEMVIPLAAVIKHVLSDFDEYLEHYLEPEPVTVKLTPIPVDLFDPSYDVIWKSNNLRRKKENLARDREALKRARAKPYAKKKKRGSGYGQQPQLNRDNDRAVELEAAARGLRK